MSISPFTSQSFDQRVVFGRDHVEALREMLDAFGVARPLVVSTGAAGERIAEALGARVAGVFAQAKIHTPVEVTERALAVLLESEADGIVSIGGGSAVGLGKALAYRTGITHIAIATTYAGSEMTPVLGQTEDGRKTTLRDKRVVPQGVIYDVALTFSLPVDVAMTSGLNAMAHAVEALYAPDRTRLSSMVAEEAIAALVEALPAIHDDPHDLDARGRALYGAWFAGQSLAMTTMGLHHKLAHMLGGLYNLPHAPMHAALLPHVVAFNQVAAGDLLAPLVKALGSDDAARGLGDLARKIGAPTNLLGLGVETKDIAAAVEAVLAGSFANPRAVTADGVRGVLEAALAR